MGKYETDWPEIGCNMYSRDTEVFVSDVSVTGMVKDDCEEFNGTHYMLWLVYIYCQDGEYTTTVIPCADDMSSEYDVPYATYEYTSLEGARERMDMLVGFARTGVLDRYITA